MPHADDRVELLDRGGFAVPPPTRIHTERLCFPRDLRDDLFDDHIRQVATHIRFDCLAPEVRVATSRGGSAWDEGDGRDQRDHHHRDELLEHQPQHPYFWARILTVVPTGAHWWQTV